jgi:hypothetical protein
MEKFEGAQNILDVLNKYEILGFCKMGLNRLSYCRIKPEISRK